MIFNNYLVLFILMLIQLVNCTYGYFDEKYESGIIVKIKQGELIGKIAEDYDGKYYYSFQGIPYAKPPVAELRFKAPVSSDPWTDIFDATKEGNECLQFDPMKNQIIGAEDCLNLNVYTPDLSPFVSPKPVMVWIHGGGFTLGSGKTNLYGPEFLITEDVVIVTFNYRLGILGFLSLEDTSLGIPGNAGLKDMVLALRWVQNNIKSFNGDPNQVTIFGESVGGTACELLILSESAKGLFHRAISQSSVVMNQWYTGNIINSLQIAQVLQSWATNEKEALEFLMAIPAEMFINAQALLENKSLRDIQMYFGPVVETPNPEAFITEHPIDLLLSGRYNKIPMIFGYTSREGMLFEAFRKINGQEWKTNTENAIPLHYNITRGTELSKRVAKMIQDFYFGNSKSTEEEDADNFYILTSDLFFIRGIYVTISAILKTTYQPIYLYRFNIDTALNSYKMRNNVTTPGVCHEDDLGYLFKGQFTPEIECGSAEDIAIKRVVRLWTQFAKTGNPNAEYNDDYLINVKWPSLESEQLQCLDLDNELSISYNPEEERMRFWDYISAMEEIRSPF